MTIETIPLMINKTFERPSLIALRELLLETLPDYFVEDIDDSDVNSLLLTASKLADSLILAYKTGKVLSIPTSKQTHEQASLDQAGYQFEFLHKILDSAHSEDLIKIVILGNKTKTKTKMEKILQKARARTSLVVFSDSAETDIKQKCESLGLVCDI